MRSPVSSGPDSCPAPAPTRAVPTPGSAATRLLAPLRNPRTLLAVVLLSGLLGVLLAGCATTSGERVFNVRDYGATGRRSDDAGPALQRAIDACAAAGGGTVRIPAGAYTSGTLQLRSRVDLEIAAGATLYASTNPAAYPHGGVPSKAALLFGDQIEDVAIFGAGTIDGQAAYEWREDDFETGFDHKLKMIELGKPLLRSFPVGLKDGALYPHLVWIGRSSRLRFEGLNWVRSPSWSLAFYDCTDLRFDGLNVQTSLKEGVWADGIDLDGCRNVRIENCRIATGDDCVVFISTDVWGPARPCENIVVRNCTLSSASAGVKFSEGNRAGIRDVQIRDCVMTNVNRGLVVYAMLGGHVSDVVVSNVVIQCRRQDWFWAGDGQPFHFRVGRVSEFTKQPPRPDEPAPGQLRRIRLQNIRAEAFGTSRLHGHPEGAIEDLVFDQVSIRVATDPTAPFDLADHAIELRHGRQVRFHRLSIDWSRPPLPAWQAALSAEESSGLQISAFRGRSAQPGPDAPAIRLHQVADAAVQLPPGVPRDSGFVRITGDRSQDIRLSEEPPPGGSPLAGLSTSTAASVPPAPPSPPSPPADSSRPSTAAVRTLRVAR